MSTQNKNTTPWRPKWLVRMYMLCLLIIDRGQKKAMQTNTSPLNERHDYSFICMLNLFFVCLQSLNVPSPSPRPDGQNA